MLVSSSLLINVCVCEHKSVHVNVSVGECVHVQGVVTLYAHCDDTSDWDLKFLLLGFDHLQEIHSHDH